MEVWKAVEGYEDAYKVSNYGRVKSVDGRTTVDKNGNVKKYKSVELKFRCKSDDKYPRVMLSKKAKREDFFVHTLVARGFIPEVPGKPFVNHKDGNKHNNHVSNLEWCTSAENNIHAVETGLNNNRHKVVLICKDTLQPLHFKSKKEASEFMGYKYNYITELLKKGKTETKKYTIQLQEDFNNETIKHEIVGNR